MFKDVVVGESYQVHMRDDSGFGARPTGPQSGGAGLSFEPSLFGEDMKNSAQIPGTNLRTISSINPHGGLTLRTQRSYVMERDGRLSPSPPRGTTTFGGVVGGLGTSN